MNTDSKNPSSPQPDVSPTSRLFDDWIDPIETGVRARVRDWIEALGSIRNSTPPCSGRGTAGAPAARRSWRLRRCADIAMAAGRGR